MSKEARQELKDVDWHLEEQASLEKLAKALTVD
jgi:hypothetical protein